MTPRPMMMPVLFRVLPKPSSMAVTMPFCTVPSARVRSAGLMPPMRAVTMAAINSAIKVCTLVLDTRTIIRIIPIARPNNMRVDSLMEQFLLQFRITGLPWQGANSFLGVFHTRQTAALLSSTRYHTSLPGRNSQIGYNRPRFLLNSVETFKMRNRKFHFLSVSFQFLSSVFFKRALPPQAGDFKMKPGFPDVSVSDFKN